MHTYSTTQWATVALWISELQGYIKPFCTIKLGVWVMWRPAAADVFFTLDVVVYHLVVEDYSGRWPRFVFMCTDMPFLCIYLNLDRARIKWIWCWPGGISTTVLPYTTWTIFLLFISLRKVAWVMVRALLPPFCIWHLSYICGPHIPISIMKLMKDTSSSDGRLNEERLAPERHLIAFYSPTECIVISMSWPEGKLSCVLTWNSRMWYRSVFHTLAHG